MRTTFRFTHQGEDHTATFSDDKVAPYAPAEWHAIVWRDDILGQDHRGPRPEIYVVTVLLPDE